MSEQVNKEQTKGAEQENITELSEQQLAEAQGGSATRMSPEREEERKGAPNHIEAEGGNEEFNELKLITPPGDD